MSKIIAVDFGGKRTGIAETDDLKMMAFGLTAVDTKDLMDFLEKYFAENKVETMVVGEPLDLDGGYNEIEKDILQFIKKISKKYPSLKIEREDERFTSKMAERSLFEMGKKKKARQNKYLIDEVSATLILQSYLENRN